MSKHFRLKSSMNPWGVDVVEIHAKCSGGQVNRLTPREVEPVFEIWIDELIDDLSRLKKEGKRLFAEGKRNRQRTFEEHRRNKE